MAGEMPPLPVGAHALALDDLFEHLGGGREGLSSSEAAARRLRCGPNEIPLGKPPGLVAIFLRQFLSPVIYILLVAAAVAMALQEWSDAGFIFAVLLLNAVIGAAQEHGAERSAAALRSLVVSQARVTRDGEEVEVPSTEVVPGDVLTLEVGSRVPADARILSAIGLESDESLLTGESLPVAKSSMARVAAGAPLAERPNMVFAGTLVARGRATCIATATGAGTEIGRIAATLATTAHVKPPLLLRTERFTRTIAIAVTVAVFAMAVVLLVRGEPVVEVFKTSVALMVAAIPEGLPVALTVALAVASARMARRRVIVRRLVAVEALGSCTAVASDKTGTLTLNELTAKLIVIPGSGLLEVTGAGAEPVGSVALPADTVEGLRAQVTRLATATALCNAAHIGLREGQWVHAGDAVDVAFLVFAHKAGVTRPAALALHPEIGAIPFESQRQYAATLHQVNGRQEAYVKGAAERVLPMCTTQDGPTGLVPLDGDEIERLADELAAAGYKVLAVAGGPVGRLPGEEFSQATLRGLALLGVVAMIDPLRPEAKAAVAGAAKAGVRVSMVTGDHPITALAIARELDLAQSRDQVVTGADLRRVAASGAPGGTASLVAEARVFARVEPEQKLDIVRGLADAGHFVAVTGDGANDAPALRAAHVGIAMGRSGTDVAREAADLILADDNFTSVVAGIEEGRVAYANIRKVIYFLVATGSAEIVIVVLALLTGDPLPLLPVQLLWLNLVTSGIQDVGLAFEAREGDELSRPPRPPQEPIFNRPMVERCLLSALVVGGTSYGVFHFLLDRGWALESARNLVLLQMVLFENVVAGSARSERHPVFRLNPLHNPLLLVGTALAQGVHIVALYTPGLSSLLALEPVDLDEWVVLAGLALAGLVLVEVHKLVAAGRLHPGGSTLVRLSPP